MCRNLRYNNYKDSDVRPTAFPRPGSWCGGRSLALPKNSTFPAFRLIKPLLYEEYQQQRWEDNCLQYNTPKQNSEHNVISETRACKRTGAGCLSLRIKPIFCDLCSPHRAPLVFFRLPLIAPLRSTRPTFRPASLRSHARLVAQVCKKLQQQTCSLQHKDR